MPVKGTESAKSRLGASAELASAIALDTVEAAVAVPDSRVVVVTSPSIAGYFTAIGARVVADPGGGLNPAIAAGIAGAIGPVAVLLGDVPALVPPELAAALVAAEEHPLAMVADADETGTVLITALNPVDHRPRFGAGSRDAHLGAGYVELPIAASSGLRRDVDTVAQLVSLGDRVGRRTAAVLGSAV